MAEGNNETLQTFIKTFFSHEDAYHTCYGLYRPDQPWDEEPTEEHIEGPDSPLYYTSFAGMVSIVSWLLDNGADVNAWAREYGTALQAASYQGHHQVVKQLLAAGANVNA